MKRILSLVLVLCMLLLMVPTFAESTGSGSSGLGGLLGGLLGGDSSEDSGLGGLLGDENSINLSDLLSSLLEQFNGYEGTGLGGLLSGIISTIKKQGADASELFSGLLSSLTEGEGLSSLVGSLLGGSSEGVEDSSLSSLIGGLLGGGSKASLDNLAATLIAGANSLVTAPSNAVPAEGIDKFVGTWDLTKVMFNGSELPLEDVLASVADKANALIITDNSFSLFMPANAPAEDASALQVKDGALILPVEGAEIKFYLTDADELYFGFLGVELYFTEAK